MSLNSSHCHICDFKDKNHPQYQKGGYHNVKIGQVYNRRYKIKRKLGCGAFSTVWLAVDLKKKPFHKHRFVAIKFHKSAKKFSKSVKIELEHLERVRIKDKYGEGNIVVFLDAFDHDGPNGLHFCFVFELLGRNLYEMITEKSEEEDQIKRERDEICEPLIPLKDIKRVTRDILEGLVFLHNECGLIHTDIKPENISITFTNGRNKEFVKPPKKNSLEREISSVRKKLEEDFHLGKLKKDSQRKSKIKAKIIDLGNSVSFDKTGNSTITTKQYRAPEVILGQKISSKVDVWALACVVFEMATGHQLFTPCEHEESIYSSEHDHLAQMMELLGEMPTDFAKRGASWRDHFNRHGKLIFIKELDFWKLKDVLKTKYNFSEEVTDGMNEFLLPMLRFRPTERVTAKKALSHPWLRLNRHDYFF